MNVVFYTHISVHSNSHYYAASHRDYHYDNIPAMCLILLAFQHQPDYPLIIAANRDELYGRPTLPAHFWPETPELFAGKDLQAGGTWMGISKNGRFAAVTNYRHPAAAAAQTISRGQLCTDFLRSTLSAEAYLSHINSQKNRYAGFNLLVGSAQQLFYYSNREGVIRELAPGIHGLSNGLLNEPWPKVAQGKTAMTETLRHSNQPDALLPILLDQHTAADSDLPATGINLETERLLSSRFIRSERYGTRSSTVLRVGIDGGAEWLEQSYSRDSLKSNAVITTIPAAP